MSNFPDKKINHDSLSAMNLFLYEIKRSLILHIPHSSLLIPDQSNYVLTKTELLQENLKLSDIGTDLVFDLGADVTKLVFPYSRLYCDVERLPDEQEEMFRVGRGFYYTKTDSGKQLRKTEQDKDKILQIYNTHHNLLKNHVEHALTNVGFCLILDCHSFSEVPFETDLNKEPNRPDICLGVDDFHTPKWLIDYMVNFFTKEGFSVKVNDPYVGTIVPLDFYKKNENVLSVMIEINRKHITNELGIADNNKIDILNKLIKKLF